MDLHSEHLVNQQIPHNWHPQLHMNCFLEAGFFYSVSIFLPSREAILACSTQINSCCEPSIFVFTFLFWIDIFFRAASGSYRNWAESTVSIYIPSAHVPPLSTPARVVHVLQSMSPYGHLVIPQSPSLALGFWVLYALWVMTNVQWEVPTIVTSHRRYNTAALNTLCAPLFILPSLTTPPNPTPDKRCSVSVSGVFAFSTMPSSWIHIVCSLFRLASFT